eukprot:10304956-Alexandrium_andersonii.AAC.1
MIASESKCALVCSSRHAERAFHAPFKAIGIGTRRWARNLGHDARPRAAKAVIVAARLKLGLTRLPRLSKFRRAVGRRIARLVSTGLSPALLHSAAVSGLSETHLSRARSLASQVLGYAKCKHFTLDFMLQPDA